MANFLTLTATKFPLSYPLDCHRGHAFFPQRGCYDANDRLFRSHHHLSLTNKMMKRSNNVRISCISAGEKPVECANKVVEEDDIAVERPLANFPPDIWGDRFDNFTLQDHLMMKRYARQSETLKEEVRAMLLDDSCDDLGKEMNLIDTVERLGFSYLYETEINYMIEQIFNQISEDNFDSNYNLFDTAVQFRVFRQHGYNMPCDVFKKFIDSEGKFKQELKNDVRGMISLYEATFLKVHGEDILEEALGFTTDFLKSIASSCKQAHQALLQPLHRGMPRVQTQHFISSYMEDDEIRNEKLLQLAKIEFNRLQLLHRQELSQIQQWWKSLEFGRKLPGVKNRSIETHFFSLGIYHEDQYSFGRILFTKMILLLVVLDDTYDAFGTFDELQQLTDAFERWDLSLMDQFPAEYMAVVYEFVINTCNEIDKEMMERNKPYAKNYAKEQVLNVIRHFFKVSKWVESRYVPDFKEYMATRRITCGIRFSVTFTLMGMLEEVNEESPYEQVLLHAPKALVTCEDMAGLLNDLFTGEMELARGAAIATSIECYMKDHNIENREEVVQIFKQMIEDGWKELVNQRLLLSTSDNYPDDQVSKPLFDNILSNARITHVNYRGLNDGFIFSNHSTIKEEVYSIFAQPFAI